MENNNIYLENREKHLDAKFNPKKKKTSIF